MADQPLPPFSCTYSPNIPELLWQLRCTLVISTYQAGKVIFLSATSLDDLIQLPRSFQKPMGLAVSAARLAVATREEVVVLANAPALAADYPRQPRQYDGLYMPRAIYFTGEVDIHDLAWGEGGLWAVNTRFSCLCLVDDEFSFRPQWRPPFISALAPDDRCHLNGMAMVDGRPQYVTALGDTDTAEGWRPSKATGGILMHVPSGEIILRDLPMPHSPRVYDQQLYLLLSATGELVCVDPQKGTYDTVTRLPGFVRGLTRYGDYLFVGLSRLRQKTSAFRDLPIAKESVFCGIVVVYLPRGHIVGHIRYETSCEEIYDVQVLPGLRRPGLVSPGQSVHRLALATPEYGFWADSSGGP